MSKTYVFLMSRKKQDLKGSTLNPGARSLGLGGYDYNPSTSNLALNSEGCPPKPARSRNIIFSDEQPNDQRHPLFKSPYERASGVNRSPHFFAFPPKQFSSFISIQLIISFIYLAERLYCERIRNSFFPKYFHPFFTSHT